MSILSEICSQRRLDVSEAKEKESLAQIIQRLNKVQFELINFEEILKSKKARGEIAIMAEIKRASPSKGNINLDVNAVKMALQYAEAGASVISVLTEPKWFKTTLQDLYAIRKALDSYPNRPAILRKEFIVDEYQIYEARVYGADTVLLIVACLSDLELASFIQKSRELNMEPLVEVANATEMQRAVSVGAKIIGINNRNLHTFTVDPSTTTNLITPSLPSSIIICALSGISSAADVSRYHLSGASAVLIGESLMLSQSPGNKILQFSSKYFPLVKICGIMEPEMAIQVAEAGADFIGLVFAESRRKIDVKKAKEIVAALRQWRKEKRDVEIKVKYEERMEVDEWFKGGEEALRKAVDDFRPLIVGVFANNSPEMVNQISKEVGLDLIQLSGKEGWEISKNLVLPAWRCVHVQNNQQPQEIVSHFQPNSFLSILLDTSNHAALGGTGVTFDWEIAEEIQKKVPIILAGGLNPSNVGNAVTKVKPFAIDVSSGVETDGKKDILKIRYFIQNAKWKRHLL